MVQLQVLQVSTCTPVTTVIHTIHLRNCASRSGSRRGAHFMLQCTLRYTTSRTMSKTPMTAQADATLARKSYFDQQRESLIHDIGLVCSEHHFPLVANLSPGLGDGASAPEH